ncbi:MAG: polyphosphate kinase 2 family protein [Anaerolineales bacterium]|nr:polyphosphate kinase 2 family protein [Anaerolineales bacterium]MCB9129209.1 polyphosphate kinase 2 family protein [Ardenticatenales bacterium]
MNQPEAGTPPPVPETEYDIYRVKPGSTVDLTKWQTSEKGGFEKDEAKQLQKDVRDELAELQRKLYAEGQQSLLVVLQATDTGGKDGTIRNVFGGVNPQGVRVASFKQPTDEELAHDFLWRIHQETPARGMIRVFNRSHYEDVLIVRVKEIVPESVWRPRYHTINEFERGLALAGTRIVKIFLHISKDEQKARLQARLDDPNKHWKFSLGDLKEREYWEDYQQAFADMLTHCSTDYAPWYVIPADRKWYRNLVITRILVDVLKGMDPHYPQNEDDLSNVVIE